MRILNLFAGVGGNRTLWGDGHKITAVEMDTRLAYLYNKRFPEDDTIVCDALDYLEKHYQEFDFIWCSPPCQSHSRWRIKHPPVIPDMTSLYGILIFLKYYFRGYWVIENVIPYYRTNFAVKPKKIIGRHCFWSNFLIEDFKIQETPKNFMYMYAKDLSEYHDIDYEIISKLKGPWKNHDMKCQVLRNCVHYKIGKFILDSIPKTKKQETINKYLEAETNG